MRNVWDRLCLLLTCVAFPGCHPYQQDPHYARARLVEILRDPFHPDNMKYTVVIGVLVVAAAAAVAFTLRFAWRRRGRSRREG